MKSLMIKDLEISKELTREDLSAVRGGLRDVNSAGGVIAAQTSGGIGSPNVIVNTPTAVQANQNFKFDFTNISQLAGNTAVAGVL